MTSCPTTMMAVWMAELRRYNPRFPSCQAVGYVCHWGSDGKEVRRLVIDLGRGEQRVHEGHVEREEHEHRAEAEQHVADHQAQPPAEVSGGGADRPVSRHSARAV